MSSVGYPYDTYDVSRFGVFIMTYSIFTGMSAGVVVGMVKSGDRLKAYNHYCVLLGMPAVKEHKKQLDEYILKYLK